MFLDWCFLTAFGYEKALALLCQPERSAGAGCTYSLRYFKNKDQFHTKDPQPGDQIFFGTSLDNSTHTGIVESVAGSTAPMSAISPAASREVIHDDTGAV